MSAQGEWSKAYAITLLREVRSIVPYKSLYRTYAALSDTAKIFRGLNHPSATKAQEVADMFSEYIALDGDVDPIDNLIKEGDLRMAIGMSLLELPRKTIIICENLEDDISGPVALARAHSEIILVALSVALACDQKELTSLAYYARSNINSPRGDEARIKGWLRYYRNIPEYQNLLVDTISVLIGRLLRSKGEPESIVKVAGELTVGAIYQFTQGSDRGSLLAQLQSLNERLFMD